MLQKNIKQALGVLKEMQILEGVHVCLEQKATEIQFKFIKYFHFNLLFRVFFSPWKSDELGKEMWTVQSFRSN